MFRRPRLPRWLIVSLCIATWVWLLHAPLLRSLAGPLIVNESDGDVSHVGILQWQEIGDGENCFNAAAALYREKPSRRFLVVERRLDRLMEIGILEPFATVSYWALKSLGAPTQAMSILRSNGCDDWATARALRTWLVDHPQASIAVFCGSFRSAHLRYALDTVLDADQAARVHVRGLRDSRYNETNWWQSRDGIKEFGIGWLRRLHGWCVGGGHPAPPSVSAGEYEDQTRHRLRLPAA